MNFALPLPDSWFLIPDWVLLLFQRRLTTRLVLSLKYNSLIKYYINKNCPQMLLNHLQPTILLRSHSCFVVHHLQMLLGLFSTNYKITSPYLTSLCCELYLAWQRTGATYFSGLNNVWKGCCQDNVFTFTSMRTHTNEYSTHTVISLPFLSNVTVPWWQLAAPCFFTNTYFSALHIVKLDM